MGNYDSLHSVCFCLFEPYRPCCEVDGPKLCVYEGTYDVSVGSDTWTVRWCGCASVMYVGAIVDRVGSLGELEVDSDCTLYCTSPDTVGLVCGGCLALLFARVDWMESEVDLRVGRI